MPNAGRCTSAALPASASRAQALQQRSTDSRSPRWPGIGSFDRGPSCGRNSRGPTGHL
jgi:hypothetical protein